jgi:PBP1b-binding outer membrane lipoprotein LpoB
MKKIIFICAVTLGMLSCSSEQANVKDAEEVSVLKIENVQRINSDEELQKVAYRLLNENEKFVFWKDRFDLLLQEDEFTSSQKQLISELQNNLTVSLFSDIINDDQEYFKNIYIPHFL